ncbi:hypothetical protein ACFLIM_38860 [Nonomuraea sp. M3C6]|uniref:Uncharacterized protein n=1 Tax=Nonomuraea marmarensis TaxID=3351344 RepID=A0ABW7AQ18_9ACTN
MGASTWSEAGHVLADELGADDLLGPSTSEDDRLRMADRLLVALDTRRYNVVKRNTVAAPAAPPPLVISASRPVAVDRLEAGMIVQRHTRQEEGSDHVETELPCCDRRMEFAADPDLEVDLVCQYDRVRYTLRLAEEYDGGFLACFCVEGQVAVAKPRPAKRKATA